MEGGTKCIDFGDWNPTRGKGNGTLGNKQTRLFVNFKRKEAGKKRKKRLTYVTGQIEEAKHLDAVSETGENERGPNNE